MRTLEPLAHAGKMGPVLFQLPPNFKLDSTYLKSFWWFCPKALKIPRRGGEGAPRASVGRAGRSPTPPTSRRWRRLRDGAGSGPCRQRGGPRARRASSWCGAPTGPSSPRPWTRRPPSQCSTPTGWWRHRWRRDERASSPVFADAPPKACCPDLTLVPRDPAREARAFEGVFWAVEVVTPLLEITAPGTYHLPSPGSGALPRRGRGAGRSGVGTRHHRPG